MVMNTAPRMHAAEELRHYLQKLDWSGLTPGRSRILEAFIELASAEGYSSVSMRSLGRKVNMKAPSIYSHFPGGRDEVVAEAFRWHFSRFAAAVLEGRTVIAIAHRLFSAHDADRVAVVEDGRISELGSHDELVDAGGSYAALWDSWHGRG